MSLELFKEYGTSNVERQAVFEPLKPPVIIAANQLISAGRTGISTYMESRFDRASNVLYINQDFIDKLYSRHSEDLGAITLGTCVVATHNALSDGYFSTVEFLKYWNSNVAGLPDFLTLQNMPEEEVEHFTGEKWREMVALAKEDPTLTSFFYKNNRHLRPDAMNQFLDENKLRKYMVKVLTPFRETAAPVVKALLSDEIVEEHKTGLEYFGEYRASVEQKIDSKREEILKDVLEKQNREIEEAKMNQEHIYQPSILNLDVSGGL